MELVPMLKGTPILSRCALFAVLRSKAEGDDGEVRTEGGAKRRYSVDDAVQWADQSLSSTSEVEP